MSLGRDDRLDTALDQPGPEIVAVISLVGDQMSGRRHGGDAGLGDRHVVDVARRQHQEVGSAARVADGVELGVAAAFGEADTMGQGPPFAPPAVRWTLKHELSMNNRSGTPSTPARSLKMRCHTPR